MNNCNHNLIHELSVKLDGVWRYDQYIKDADQNGCADRCCHLFREIKKEDEKHIAMLREEIFNHVKEDKFD